MTPTVNYSQLALNVDMHFRLPLSTWLRSSSENSGSVNCSLSAALLLPLIDHDSRYCEIDQQFLGLRQLHPGTHVLLLFTRLPYNVVTMHELMSHDEPFLSYRPTQFIQRPVLTPPPPLHARDFYQARDYICNTVCLSTEYKHHAS